MNDQAGRIAMVLQDLSLGGGERIAIRLADRWADLGRQVVLFCGARTGALAEMIGSNIEVVECAPRIPRGAGSRAALGEKLAAFLTERPTDLLFVPGNYQWPVMPAVGRLPDALRPVTVAQVGTPLYRHGRGPLRQIGYNLRTRSQFRRVDLAVSLSARMTGEMDRALGRRITQCVPLPALDDDIRPAPLSAIEPRLIVAAGRLVPEKGFDVALRAFAQLDDPPAKLVILGEGPERERLWRLACDLGLDQRVALPGFVADIRPWLERARLFLLSSYYEGYAAVVIEALAAGRPVVCTDCTPAAGELVSRRAGAIAPIGDAAALALALRRVLDAPVPAPERLAALVQPYRIGGIAQNYLDIFDYLTTHRRSVVANLDRRAGGWKGFTLPFRPAGATLSPEELAHVR
jgi:glycosyltransferase involved in cell wall biosynthesis